MTFAQKGGNTDRVEAGYEMEWSCCTGLGRRPSGV